MLTLTYARLMKWFDFPSIVGVCTIIRDGKCYMVTIKCNGRSYVILLVVLPLHHLKYKLCLKQTYTEIHFLTNLL